LHPYHRQRYIFAMWRWGLFALILAASLLLAGLSLVPAGCGPYSVVYGPATALRAQRAFLFLTLVLVALIVFAPEANWQGESFVLRRHRCAPSGPGCSALLLLASTLRC